MPGDTHEPLAVWASLLRAHAVLTGTLERELIAEHDLPLVWYEVLYRISRAGRPVRMQELAASVLLSKSGLTRVVDRMEAAGLVTRTSCPHDRRGVFVTTTPAGAETLEAATPVFLRGIARHFTGRLDDADLAALRAILVKLVGEAPELDACEPATAATTQPEPAAR